MGSEEPSGATPQGAEPQGPGSPSRRTGRGWGTCGLISVGVLAVLAIAVYLGLQYLSSSYEASLRRADRQSWEESQAVEEGRQVDGPSSVAYGGDVRFRNGLRVTAEAPVAFTPPPPDRGLPPYDREGDGALRVRVTVTNTGTRPIELERGASFTTSQPVTRSLIIPSGHPDGPMGLGGLLSLGPGRTASWWEGVDAPAGDPTVTMTLTPFPGKSITFHR